MDSAFVVALLGNRTYSSPLCTWPRESLWSWTMASLPVGSISQCFTIEGSGFAG